MKYLVLAVGAAIAALGLAVILWPSHRAMLVLWGDDASPEAYRAMLYRYIGGYFILVLGTVMIGLSTLVKGK